MTIADEPTDLTVTLPLDTWLQFPDGARLGAELRRLAEEGAKGRGRTIDGAGTVSTDKASGVYRATYPLAPTN